MRTRSHWLLVLIVAVNACGSKSSGAPAAVAGPCALRKGTYSITFHERSGDCGALTEQIVVVDETRIDNAPLAPNCTGIIQNEPDNCSTQEDTSCPGANGFHVKFTGKVSWAEDGSMGGGVIQLRLTEDATGLLPCSSSYDVSYVRQ